LLHGVLTKLSQYNQVMNAAVYAAAAKLSDEQRKQDLGAFFKSIHATLNHILWADKNWLGRFVLAGHGYGILSEEIARNIQGRTGEHAYLIHADFAELSADRTALDAALISWVREGLSEEKLAQTLRYKSARGDEMSRPFADVLTHFFNHQTHHRGQVTTLLTQQGIDTGVTDFIFYSNKFT
jgi:uncharacterized damage-inducible protein DinB